MIYLYYILLVPISVLLEFVIARPLSVVLPLFATQQMGWCDNHSYEAVEPRLPSWLSLFMTPDNSLDGDATFKRLNPPSYWAQVKWLWRNPVYAFALKYLKTPYECRVYGNKTIKDNGNAKAGWCLVHANGLFQLTAIAPIGFARCIRLTLGWNIMALVDDNVQPKPNSHQATFVFSPRLSGFR